MGKRQKRGVNCGQCLYWLDERPLHEYGEPAKASN